MHWKFVQDLLGIGTVAQEYETTNMLFDFEGRPRLAPLEVVECVSTPPMRSHIEHPRRSPKFIMTPNAFYDPRLTAFEFQDEPSLVPTKTGDISNMALDYPDYDTEAADIKEVESLLLGLPTEYQHSESKAPAEDEAIVRRRRVASLPTIEVHEHPEYRRGWTWKWCRVRSTVPIQHPDPPEDAQLSVGDLFIDVFDDGVTVWTLLSTLKWQQVHTGSQHPTRKAYVLACRDELLPTWVSRKTYATYKWENKKQNKANRDFLDKGY